MAIATVNHSTSNSYDMHRIAKMRALLDAMEQGQSMAFYTGHEWVMNDPNEAICYLASSQGDLDAVRVIGNQNDGPQLLPRTIDDIAQEAWQTEAFATA